jgi:anti-sigma regulatory factor (Ser/Thr protein kinase)
MTMCDFDTAQPYCIALQLDTVLREEFVEFTYSLPSDVEMVSPFIDQLMRKVNILRPMDGTEVDIEVALREALLNAVVHGNREDPSKRIYLRVRCRADGEVSMAIRDEGAGFEINSVPDPTAPEQLMSKRVALLCTCSNVQACPTVKHSNSEKMRRKCRGRCRLWRQQTVDGIERPRQMRGTEQSVEEQFPIIRDRSAGVAGRARSWERHFRRPTERPFTAEERDRATILFGGLT